MVSGAVTHFMDQPFYIEKAKSCKFWTFCPKTYKCPVGPPQSRVFPGRWAINLADWLPMALVAELPNVLISVHA